jgi:hypothetical protein
VGVGVGVLIYIVSGCRRLAISIAFFGPGGFLPLL